MLKKISIKRVTFLTLLLITVIVSALSYFFWPTSELPRSRFNKVAHRNLYTSQRPPVCGKNQMVDLFDGVNDYRSKLGLKILVWDNELERLANQKSADMAINEYFGHDDLMNNKSYVYLRRDYDWWGENLYVGRYTSADEILRMWQESPGHDRNLKDSRFGQGGLGCVCNSESCYVSLELTD